MGACARDRPDEVAVVAAGSDVLRLKLGISAVSGAYAGRAAGSTRHLPQLHRPFLFRDPRLGPDPDDAGGGGRPTLSGSIIGPFLLWAMPQSLMPGLLPSTMVGPVRRSLYGVLLVAFMLFRPQGIAGRRL